MTSLRHLVFTYGLQISMNQQGRVGVQIFDPLYNILPLYAFRDSMSSSVPHTETTHELNPLLCGH
jgi:hypothetical protein